MGAFAVLYSTLFVAAAGMARMVVDGLILAGVLPGDPASRARWIGRISVAWPLVALVLENWSNEDGWVKVAITEQDNS